jgi:hypothetical protein
MVDVTGVVLAPVPICAEMVTVAAPEAVILAGAKSTLAVPVESVSAVPEAGEKVPKRALVANVTTVPTDGAPVVSLRIAVTLAGFPDEIDVRAAPVPGSVRDVVITGAAVDV